MMIGAAMAAATAQPPAADKTAFITGRILSKPVEGWVVAQPQMQNGRLAFDR
jgi:hypothetical protein